VQIDKVSLMVLEKMDPCYSFGGLSSQQSTSCEPSIGSFQGWSKFPSTSTCMIMIAPLSNRNRSAKTITDSMKFSMHMFHWGMKDNGLKTCKIRRLNGTFARTRSTLFLEDTLKKEKHLQEG
jgi:hypothetical protein